MCVVLAAERTYARLSSPRLDVALSRLRQTGLLCLEKASVSNVERATRRRWQHETEQRILWNGGQHNHNSVLSVKFFLTRLLGIVVVNPNQETDAHCRQDYRLFVLLQPSTSINGQRSVLSKSHSCSIGDGLQPQAMAPCHDVLVSGSSAWSKLQEQLYRLARRGKRAVRQRARTRAVAQGETEANPIRHNA